MELKIITKYNIGDKVWVYRYITEGRDYKNWSFGIEQRRIKYIRVIHIKENTNEIEYFLEGLSSYEGENWFPEKSPDPNNPIYDEGIFKTKYEAEIYFKLRNE